MAYGLIARADHGGLAAQTWEIARHTRPARVLIVRVADARGPFTPERFDGFEARVCGNPPDVADLAWVRAAGHVFTVEGCYNDRLLDIAHKALSIHVNPELFPDRYRDPALRRGFRVLAPTDWALDRLPLPEVLWMPVASDVIPSEVRSRPARRFLHVSAPAMLDRNGSELLRAAYRHYRGPQITVVFAGPRRPRRVERHGAIIVEPAGDVAEYWERYTPDLDALVLPRRYGGLSLTMQESLAAGLPVVCLDRHPEHSWSGTRVVPIHGREQHRMKGGRYTVEHCLPQALAAALQTHAEDDPEPFSRAAQAHGRAISWAERLPEWTRTITGTMRP